MSGLVYVDMKYLVLWWRHLTSGCNTVGINEYYSSLKKETINEYQSKVRASEGNFKYSAYHYDNVVAHVKICFKKGDEITVSSNEKIIV